MKNILRIFIILIAGAMITAITLVAVNASSATTAQRFGGRGGRDSQRVETLGANQEAAGFIHDNGLREMNDELHGEVFLWGETIKNTSIVAVFVLVVVLIERLLKTWRMKKT